MRFWPLCRFFAACASGGAAPASSKLASGYRPIDFQETADEVPQEHRRHASSLWVDNNSDNYLFTDHKARRVNDVITVNIIEDSDAKGKADTKTEKTSTIGAGVDGFFGMEQVAARRNPNLRLDTLVGAKTGTKFNGKGETKRSGKLVAVMSCLVVDVLPNGNLVIRGERRLRLNDEDYIMVMSGIVRPRDIHSDNSVESTMVADARIEYLGEGVLADKMKPGWFTRAFDKVWPF
ncbi:MAG: flagellar basal body L-ring protein FlgH [Deltaproteobacteria bacterium]|nr:flagellar basal body L-ring protein FlgH [Deltaproteobacteria bacterium]